MSRKEKGEIPKKKEVEDLIPLKLFQRYMQNTIFGTKKSLGLDGTMNALGGHYVMTLNTKDPKKNVGYDL